MTTLRIHHKILIVTGVFVLSAVIMFLLMQHKTSDHEDVYSSSLQDASLPVVAVIRNDREINSMHGYTSKVGLDVAYDTLTLLPDDRKLLLRAVEKGDGILSAAYEIRSEDLSELIEHTDIRETDRNGSSVEMNLPIQNLLIRNREYRLDLILKTRSGKEVHYYTRIMLADDMQLAEDMIALAEDFSAKNQDFDAARDNTKYMETDGTADDSTLSFVNLKSTFSNLAYAGLKLKPVGDKNVRLAIYDGNTGEVHINFIARRDINEERFELYEVREVFSMRMGTARIYLMNYARSMHEIFTGNLSTMAGKRILLGINDEDNIDVLTAADDRYTYFRSTRDLWMYDTQEQSLQNIFSFRNGYSDSVEDAWPNHDIKLLSAEEDGSIVFLLYGYMNRGVHEGETGISYMRYSPQTDLLTESFFIPIERDYQSIALDVNELSYVGQNNMFYFKAEDNFYAVDTKGDNYIVLAAELKDDTYRISKNKNKLAWQEDNSIQGSSTIHVMDLDTGIKKEIRSEEGILLKPEGFLGRDLAVSIRNKSDAWILHGRLKMIPAGMVEIMDDDLNVLMHYEKPDLWIGEVDVHDGRVNLQLMRKTGQTGYAYDTEDTIVSSVEAPDRPEGWGYYTSEDKARVYYVKLEEDVKRGRIEVAARTDIVSRESVIGGITAGADDRYRAYSNGKLTACRDNLSDAVIAAYDNMGTVRHAGTIVYNRAGTVTTRVIGQIETMADDILSARAAGTMTDLSGLTLKQVLYFVSIKKPVLAYAGDGTAYLIYYYDKTTVSLYNTATGEKEHAEISEASEMFDRGFRDFSCRL